MFFKTTNKNILLAIVIFLIASSQAQAKTDWAKVKTELTLQEYLSIFFVSHIKPHNPQEKVETHFIANSSPENAILYIVLPIVVPVSDLPTRADLTKSLKKKTDLYINHVNGLFRDSSVAKRWQNVNTKDNLVIHLVDSHDRSKTIGLYVNGNSTFDAQETKKKLIDIRKKVGEYIAK